MHIGTSNAPTIPARATQSVPPAQCPLDASTTGRYRVPYLGGPSALASSGPDEECRRSAVAFAADALKTLNLPDLSAAYLLANQAGVLPGYGNARSGTVRSCLDTAAYSLSLGPSSPGADAAAIVIDGLGLGYDAFHHKVDLEKVKFILLRLGVQTASVILPHFGHPGLAKFGEFIALGLKGWEGVGTRSRALPASDIRVDVGLGLGTRVGDGTEMRRTH